MWSMRATSSVQNAACLPLFMTIQWPYHRLDIAHIKSNLLFLSILTQFLLLWGSLYLSLSLPKALPTLITFHLYLKAVSLVRLSFSSITAVNGIIKSHLLHSPFFVACEVGNPQTLTLIHNLAIFHPEQNKLPACSHFHFVSHHFHCLMQMILHPDIWRTRTSHPLYSCNTSDSHLPTFYNRLIGMKCLDLRSLSVTDCREVTASGSLLHLINSRGIRVNHEENVPRKESDVKKSGACGDGGIAVHPIIPLDPAT